MPDLALALLLQEEERAAAAGAREERERRARQQLGDGGQYSKVQLAFQLQEAAALPVHGVGNGRVLLGEADAMQGPQEQGEEDEEEGEGGLDEEDPLGLSGISGVGAGGGRRRRRGELMRTAGGSVSLPSTAFNALKHDLRRQAGTLKGVAARGKMEASARATQEGVLDAR
jgi:hypothetical protein